MTRLPNEIEAAEKRLRIALTKIAALEEAWDADTGMERNTWISNQATAIAQEALKEPDDEYRDPTPPGGFFKGFSFE